MWCNLHSRESGCGLSAAHCSALDSRAHKAKTLSRRALPKSMDVWHAVLSRLCFRPSPICTERHIPDHSRWQVGLRPHPPHWRESHLLWYPVGRMDGLLFTSGAHHRLFNKTNTYISDGLCLDFILISFSKIRKARTNFPVYKSFWKGEFSEKTAFVTDRTGEGTYPRCRGRKLQRSWNSWYVKRFVV